VTWKDVQELTKLRLNSMVLVTALIGYLLAAGDWADAPRLLNLLLGLACAATGASMLNQYLERDVDRLMRRTAGRPLPAGHVQPEHVLIIGLGCAVGGVALLALFVNLKAGLLCVATLVSYLLLYTPLKRRTPLCTIVGAVPGAMPPLIGWVAASDQFTAGGWILFSILFMWQLPHFYAIAWIYRADYAAAGQAMISLMDEDGRHTAQHMVLCSVNLLVLSLIPALLYLAGMLYFVAALVLGIGFVILGLRFWRQRTVDRARWVMRGSLVYLPCVLAMWLLDAV
jgi:protoheme IX farnesyltransferase